MSAVRRRKRRRGKLAAIALKLTATSLPAASVTGTTVGTLTNKLATSTVTLIDNAGKFTLVGSAINTTGTLTAGTYNLTLKEVQLNGVQQVSSIVVTAT